MTINPKSRMSKDGDMVDLIAYEEYGDEAGRSAIHNANPGLADMGLILPAGILLQIPRWQRPDAPVPHGGVAAR
ncbi:tail protein X [Polycladidibacter hongkongensis]|uniref:tail protein X n=1 Tax=Polycladidibacter hongkongensis TaxID=1647556 RepID=UPI000AF267F5|nr:tail protein X [Pseudovibrio hongkongensis]